MSGQFGDVYEPGSSVRHNLDGQQPGSPSGLPANPGTKPGGAQIDYGLIGGIPGMWEGTHILPGFDRNPESGGAGTQHVG